MAHKRDMTYSWKEKALRIVAVAAMLMLAYAMPAMAQHKRTKRPKVGLVLGGGGAKGAAEIGVLKYIEKAGVPIDYIVGTSIGSIIGGLYSCGWRANDLDTLFRSEKWLNLFTGRREDLRKKYIAKENGVSYIFGFPVGKNDNEEYIKGYGILRGDSICRFLEELTQRPDSISFNHLPIPFRCVATEATTFTEKVFDSGNLAECMRASMSIPLVFKPVVMDSLIYVDGGMINNLPVDVCRSMGADIIIAIDLTQNHHDDDEISNISEARFNRIMHYPNLFKLFAWARYRPDLAKYQDNRKSADIYINPMLKGFKASSFKKSKIERMIEAGEKAGEKAFPQLKQLRKRL